ncbi:MAG: hypothetical protein IVW54_22915 [Candidatus Binataceae bacterium]|nr:hypothetical protein [Candidatus Binataceae bacterium]
MKAAALTFHPRQKNPARKSGRGVYRVVACWRMPGHGQRPVCREGRVLYVEADRVYQQGSRVDPLRLALRGLTAQ